MQKLVDIHDDTAQSDWNTHCDFCEQCAMYEQGDPVDPCDVGKQIYQDYYGVAYDQASRS